MTNQKKNQTRILLILMSTLAFSSCKAGSDVSAVDPPTDRVPSKTPVTKKDRILILAAYTTPREVYGKKIIPEFKAYWKEKTGEKIEIRESYLGSGAQSRAIVAGFEADITALSLEPDVARIVEAGLITRNWKAGPNKGMVSRSVVVFGVRKGNPLNVATWDDLATSGRKVLTPNVKTSGGAMWNIAAIYGAALRGHTSAKPNNDTDAQALLSRVLANVTIMDKGARESMLTFENGVGDVIITYENEMRVAAKMGREAPYAIPPSTILIENPVAVVDQYADSHGVMDVADAFVSFLYQPKIQRYFAEFGLRPVDESACADVMANFPPLKDLFTIGDLGDWPALTEKLFGANALYDRAIAAAGAKR